MKIIPGIIHIPQECTENFLDIPPHEPSPFVKSGLCMAGVSNLTRGYVISRPHASWHVFLYTMGGCGKLILESGEIQYLPQNSLLHAPIDTSYRYETAKDSWHICWFHVSRGQQMFHNSPQSIHHLKARFSDDIFSLAQMHLRESRRGGLAEKESKWNIERLILHYLQREFTYLTNPCPPNELKINQLEALVDGQLAFPWNIEELASRIHISGIYLIQLMKKYRNTTPMGFVFRLRMQRAQDLLRTTAWPLKTIAPLVGYQTPFALSHAFKRYCGQSPREFRISITKNQP